MQPNRSLHVVFGATGAIGSAAVGELLRRGHSVRAVSRRGQAPEGAQGMAADASDPAQPADAAAGATVIYHCASPPYTKWPELFPALTRSILGAAESSGAKLVFADNLYAYGPTGGPLREDLPASARGRKGRIRAEMAGQLLGAYRDGRARIVIARASDYYGPRGTGSVAGETLFGRILAGKKPLWTGGSISRTPSASCLTSPAGCCCWPITRQPMGRSGTRQLPGRSPPSSSSTWSQMLPANPCRSRRASPGQRCSRPRASSRRCSGRCVRRPTSSGRPSLSTRASSKPPSAPRAHPAPRRRAADTRLVPLPLTRWAARPHRTARQRPGARPPPVHRQATSRATTPGPPRRYGSLASSAELLNQPPAGI